MAGRGKIDSLPFAIREQLNIRMRDGLPGSQILPWLNGLPEVQAVLARQFGGEAVTDNNLSNYRLGVYAKWEARQGKLDHLRDLSRYAAELAQAGGGSLAGGASSILCGKILETLEAVEEGEATPEMVKALVDQVATLRAGDQVAAKLKIEEQKLKQRERVVETLERRLSLEREKFERSFSEKMLSETTRKLANEIASRDISHEHKIAAMRQALFADVADLEKRGGLELPAS